VVACDRIEMALAKNPAVIPFDEIVSGATVRFCVIDGVQYLSIHDLIKCVCGKNNKRAYETWDNISQTLKDELSDFLGCFQFPGRGQSNQPVVTFTGALKLIMFLPGNTAKMHRLTMVDILRRYFAGDMSLFDEMARNAQSNSPIAQMARESLVSDGIEIGQIKDEDEVYSRKRKQAELYKLEVDAKCAMMGKQIEIVDMVTQLYANKEMDSAIREQLKDSLLKMMTQAEPPVPVSHEKAKEVQDAPDEDEASHFTPKPKGPAILTVARVAEEMGVKLDEKALVRIDQGMHWDHMDKYGADAKEKRARVNGKDLWLHAYYQQDYWMIANLIREWRDARGDD